MIHKIKTAEEAEALLRKEASGARDECLVFDIAPEADASRIPLILRVCPRECTKPSEYCGPNIWGKGFEKRSTYCACCGYAMKSLAEVAVAIQGARVIETNYRNVA